MQYKKWEGPKLASLKQRSFSFHFLYSTNGVDTWELLKVKSKVNDNFKGDVNTCISVQAALSLVAYSKSALKINRPLNTSALVHLTLQDLKKSASLSACNTVFFTNTSDIAEVAGTLIAST